MCTSAATDRRVVTASRSPLIWVLGVNAAMRRFGLRNEQVHAARDAYLLTYGAAAVVAARDSKRSGRLLQKVTNAELRYPGISSRFQVDTLQAIGDDFNLSRQRVHALFRNLQLLADTTGKPVASVVNRVTAKAKKLA